MVKVYQLYRGNNPMNNKLYRSESDAYKQKIIANKQFREHNKWIKQNNIALPKVKLVKVKEVNHNLHSLE